MPFEWDERKRQSNIEKHGVDFADLKALFNGKVLEEDDRRHDYGEQRIKALGELGGGILSLSSIRGVAIAVV